MKSPKDNLIQLYRRNGYNSTPVGFVLCESLEKEFKKTISKCRKLSGSF